MNAQQQQQQQLEAVAGQLLRIQRIESFTPPLPITHLLAASGRMLMAFPSNYLHCVDTRRSDSRALQRLDLTRGGPDDRLHSLFLDPTGCHILASMQSGCVLYASWSRQQDASIAIRPVAKLKDQFVDSVAWCLAEEGSVASYSGVRTTGTGPILVGTSEGQIYELALAAEGGGIGSSGGSGSKKLAMGLLGSDDRKAEHYCHPLYNLSKSVTGLQLGIIQSAETSAGDRHKKRRCFLLASTPVQLYEFKGKLALTADSTAPPYYAPLFAKALSEPGGPPFKSHPPDMGRSCLRLLSAMPRGDEYTVAWLSGLGCYCGFIDHGLPGFCTDKCILLLYENKQVPITVESLNYHVVLLYTDRLAVHSLLNGLQVCRIDAQCRNQLPYRGMTFDASARQLWAFTEIGVYKVDIGDERALAWRIYLQLGQHEQALQCCPSQSERSQVYTLLAEKFFASGKYIESANLFSKSDRPFEHTALKFLAAPNGDVDGLKILLKCRLNAHLSSSSSSSSSATVGGGDAVLLIWLTELYLKKLGAWRDTGHQDSQDYALESEEFRRFLAKPQLRPLLERLRQVIYQLMRSHADSENLVYLACLLNDQDSIVLFYLENEEYAEALKTIDSHPRCPALHVRHAQLLVSQVPEKTVDSWISLGGKLDPRMLLPALLTAPRDQALRYLEFAVNTLHSDHKPLHNLLLHIYSESHPGRLVTYIETAAARASDREQVALPFDAKYALDLCQRCDLKKPCVRLHHLLGHYREAVALALEFDVGLAKSMANLPHEQDEKRALWLMVARHVITKENDVPRAMEFLDDCPDLLSIEDVLPFFPDFATIDSFKEAICRSLDQYKERMDALRQRMDKCTEYAATVRSRMAANKLSCHPVGASQICSGASCGFGGLLLSGTFLAYPCGHCLHSDCARQALVSAGLLTAATSAGVGPEDDCPLCGEAAIACIDVPL